MHTVETILISVISMLADPNDESPANVDAAVGFSTLSAPSCNNNLFKITERMARKLSRFQTESSSLC